MPRELRTLVGASYDVFMRLSRLADERRLANRDVGPFEVVQASRQYREALKTCIFAIEDRVETQQSARSGAAQASTSATGSSSDDDDEFVDLLKVSLAIWHLCELLFLQRRARDDKWLAYDVAQWLQEHFASALMEQLEAASAALERASRPEDDPAYWSTVHSFAMAGCGRSAWRLLSAHSSYQALATRDAASLTSQSTRASFVALQRLLLSMPGKAPAASGDASETVEWTQWHDACQYVLNTDAHIKSSAGLSTLVRILVAEDDALVRHASSWYELMMARLFLDEPKRVAHRLEFLMASCFRTYNADAAMGNFDCIILAILQHDVQSALQDIHALGFSWMAAHVADLLTKSGAIATDELAPLGVSLQEFVLLQYAMDIGASTGLWQLALGYYERCPRFGLVAARSLLVREPVPTDSKAQRLIALCHGKRGLSALPRAIALRRARACKQRKLFGAALVWLLRGSHVDEVDAVCDAVLRECAATHSLAALNEATEFLEAHREMAQTPLLAWLVQYRELFLVLDDSASLLKRVRELEDQRHADPQERDDAKTQLAFVQREAAKRLHGLVSSTAAPSQLRAVLLTEAETLLAVEPTVFASQHIYALMAYLQQLDRAFDRAQFFASHANAQLKARVETLLARNLSDAILIEARAASSAASCALSIASGGAASSSDVPRLAASVSAMDED